MTDEAGQLGSIATGAQASEAGPAEAAGLDGEAIQKRSPWRRRFTLAGYAIVFLAAALVLPPLISIGRYQRQVTTLMTQAMGRPVRLSDVELRLLPRPGFVIHDLAVSEDPGFGAEPILSARTVVAAVAFFPLWRGRLEISRVSVDEASLNLVRSADGRWNLESLMMGVQPGARPGETAGAPGPGSATSTKRAGRNSFPYLEATNSRVNLKNGVEKTPFSIVNTDLSLWQDEPGAWRVRLRGQPVRTDLDISQGDTGEIRLEASLRSAGQLRDMPLKLQMEWRHAQMGQLSRMITGSDAGWRGELTADIDVIGSLESAQTKTRLRATGVRREEFAPDTPLDFDANCTFLYRHSENAFHQVNCDTAIGSGELRLVADLPGNSGTPEAMLEVMRVPVQAGLDVLRTVRSDFAPGISIKGTANGSLTYKVVQPSVAEKPAPHERRLRGKPQSAVAAAPASNLTGNITVDQGILQGGELKEDLVLPKMVWSPGPSQIPAGDTERKEDRAAADSEFGLVTRFAILLPPVSEAHPAGTRARPVRSQPAKQAGSDRSKPDAAPGAAKTDSAVPGSPEPDSSAGDAVSAKTVPEITVQLSLGARGFEAHVSGSAGIEKLRNLAYAFGAPHLDAADELAGGTAKFDLVSTGPWIPADLSMISGQPSVVPANSSSYAAAWTDSVFGSLQLPHGRWKPPYLARAVDLTQATVTLEDGSVRLNSDFSFGAVKSPVKGSAALTVHFDCKAADCRPQVKLKLSALDASAVQTAFLGEPEEKSLFSPLLDEVARMRSSGAAKWPDVALTAQADSLVLGPATLRKLAVEMRPADGGLSIENWQAESLGGSAHGTGRIDWVAGKPEYSFEGSFIGFTPGLVESLIAGSPAADWSGGPLTGTGKVTLSGLTEKDLTASAAGELQFSWPHGVLGATSSDAAPKPVRFDSWSGSATIESGKIRLGKNVLKAGRRTSTVGGVVPFGKPAALTTGGSGVQTAEPGPGRDASKPEATLGQN